MPYTIVLAPPIDETEKYIKTSQELYSDYQPSYLLNSEGTSSPHITVVQFDCPTAEGAYEVWYKICDELDALRFESFSPPFSGLAFVDGVGPYNNTTWVELSVKRGDEDSPIMKVHCAALKVLKSSNIEPLNASQSNYRPHLTLARIILPKHVKTCPKSLYENSGKFRMEFGLSDEKWQYARTLEIFPEKDDERK
ncbi:MAG: hypothetical protein ACHQUC_10175 [Chlamydiales bacterium]